MKKLLGFIVKLIVSLAVAIVIYLCSSIDIIATVLLFLVGKILIDFLGNRRIMNNKIKNPNHKLFAFVNLDYI